jgi:hypothetical protein
MRYGIDADQESIQKTCSASVLQKRFAKMFAKKNPRFRGFFCDADDVSLEGSLVLQPQDHDFLSSRFLLYEPFMVECASCPAQLFHAE